jgi:NAD+ synthase (glutamine-hydrolysing)
MPRLRIAAAQSNLVVGDIDGNAARVLEAYDAAVAADADVVAFPELAVTGYPPEDLLLRPAFIARSVEVLEKIAAHTGRTAAIVGFPERLTDGTLANSAAVCADGRVVGVYRKQELPNYAVFDERRYFIPGHEDGPLFEIGGVTIAVSICEDAWIATGPIRRQAASGARIVINVNASPYFARRGVERIEMLAERARDAGVPIVYVNLVGGQDELVFDGDSLVVDADGTVAARAKQFVEDLLIVDVEPAPARVTPLAPIVVSGPEIGRPPIDARIEEPLSPVREVYEALVLGTRDYVRKTGFHAVLIGLSGGVDSSLVAAIAVDALGAENVVGVLMPSRYSSGHSVSDAELLAAHLGIQTVTVPIEEAHAAFLDMLRAPYAELAPDVPEGLAEENLQARVRGTILMTLSNKLGHMVLTTGNKSEMATGYSTLYGDMAGGFAVIKDVPKTLVYALCEERNERAGRELIPRTVLDKPPSAELRPDQKDSDSLPPYDQLDALLERYVEGDISVAELIALGHDRELVERVARLVDRNEYKRRQAPPGVRVSRKAFGKDRRLPITNRWFG